MKVTSEVAITWKVKHVENGNDKMHHVQLETGAKSKQDTKHKI